MPAKFKVGDRIRVLSSPSDLNKSVGLVGEVTAVLPTVINFTTGDVAIAYGLRLDKGPTGQQAYAIAGNENTIEAEGAAHE